MQGEIVVWGEEAGQGRALFVISALHHCGEWLAGRQVRIRFVDVQGAPVRLALDCLRFDTGLKVAVSAQAPADCPDEVFRDAGIYVGVVFSRPGRLALAQARERGVRCLIAIQFPEESSLNAHIVANLGCAHDPRELARRIRQEVLAVERAEGDACG